MQNESVSKRECGTLLQDPRNMGREVAIALEDMEVLLVILDEYVEVGNNRLRRQREMREAILLRSFV